MRRGRFVTVVTAGDYGKARPALIVQSDLFEDLPSVVVFPLTSTLHEDADLFRLDVAPTAQNGLHEASQIALDKVTVVPVANLGPEIGVADETLMLRVNRALALFLGLA